MMNATVARIVDLMFENTEMTEEVTALRDEVMNNCQERYADLIASGIPEDDAVAAVVESLRGMESVVAQYPRRHAARAAHAPADAYTSSAPLEPGERDRAFASGEVHAIDLTLINEDVYFEASDDGMYHVVWEEEEVALLTCGVHNGVLTIRRNPGAEKQAHVQEDAEPAGGLLKSLGRGFGRFFGGAIRVMTSCDDVTISVPHGALPHVKVVTTSGDIDVTNVALADLTVTSTSGDINIDVAEDERMERVELRTVSGDIDATVHADAVTASTTSGDVNVYGAIGTVEAHTVSGDVDVTAEVDTVRFRTVSGDADITCEGDAVREISGSTVSGDTDIDLPMGLVMGITTQTRSGDVTTRYSGSDYGSAVTGHVSSMSGDITIR